jgi:aryl-alcohol dehydrogenase-like predicted oxidoreductase
MSVGTSGQSQDGTNAPLPKRCLGRTGLLVTELGLGGYMFTGEFDVPRLDADGILDLALDSGINYFDVAQMYGFGEAEELLARAFLRHPHRTAYVSTKVGWLDRTVVRNLGEKAYQEEKALRRAIEHSFWLLRRDTVDIFMIHEPDWQQWGLDRRTGDAPVMRVLENYRQLGRIGAIGLGSWDCEVVADLIETGRFDVALVAGGYTLTHQTVRQRVIPAARQHNVGLVMGGTFLQGLLATPQRERMLDIQRRSAYQSDRLTPEFVQRVLAIYDLCDETGIAITEMAIRFILSDPAIACVIPGAQKVDHLRQNIAATRKGPLPADVLARIEAIGRMDRVLTVTAP